MSEYADKMNKIMVEGHGLLSMITFDDLKVADDLEFIDIKPREKDGDEIKGYVVIINNNHKYLLRWDI
jgi:hypothetical protein